MSYRDKENDNLIVGLCCGCVFVYVLFLVSIWFISWIF